MRARFILGCATLVAALITAGCAQPADRPPSIAAGESSPSVALPSTGPACDPRASLRPLAPLPAPGEMPAGSTMAEILKRGYLKAGVNRDYPPFAVRTERDGQLAWEGFDIDVVLDITQAIFGVRDPNKVHFFPLNVADRIPAAKKGDVDLVVSTITITCQRRVDAEFSTVYFEAQQKVLVNKNSGIRSMDDLGGKRVCASHGSTPLDLVSKYRSHPIPVEVSATTNCLALLQLGEVDAVSTDDALLAGMAAQDRMTEVVGPGLHDEPYGVAISHDHPDLTRFVNAVLAKRVQDGSWSASYQRWLAGLLGPLPPPPAPQYRD